MTTCAYYNGERSACLRECQFAQIYCRKHVRWIIWRINNVP